MSPHIIGDGVVLLAGGTTPPPAGGSLTVTRTRQGSDTVQSRPAASLDEWLVGGGHGNTSDVGSSPKLHLDFGEPIAGPLLLLVQMGEGGSGDELLRERSSIAAGALDVDLPSSFPGTVVTVSLMLAAFDTVPPTDPFGDSENYPLDLDTWTLAVGTHHWRPVPTAAADAITVTVTWEDA